MIASICLVILAVHHGDYPLMMFAVYLGAFVIGITIIVGILSQRTKCPLCMVPTMGNPSCVKHRRARKLFGSYRFRVALSALFAGYFACPYCQEMTSMEVRASRHRRGS